MWSIPKYSQVKQNFSWNPVAHMESSKQIKYST